MNSSSFRKSERATKVELRGMGDKGMPVDAREVPEVFGPGLLIADKYRIEGLIGSGAMGTVWRATHTLLGHAVAIKLLHVNVAATPDLSNRFTKEAKLCARLGETCRQIARVIDYGILPSSVPFLVMELLKGEELQTRVRRDGRLPLDLVVEIVTQLGRALHIAHTAGVIHRDLKPANVFLCAPEEGREGVLVKLLDFGIAKASLENEDSQATRAGTILGTPGYMSPEQITGESELDARSDLWSLAVLVYRMTVGRTPFRSGSVQELGVRILSTDPAWPSSVCSDLPLELDRWMQKGLAKNREDRFQTAGELVTSLSAVATATGIALRTARPMAPSQPDDPSLLPPAQTMVRRKAVAKSTLTIWLLAVALVGSVLYGSLARTRPPEPPQDDARGAHPPPHEEPSVTTASDPSEVVPRAEPSIPSPAIATRAPSPNEKPAAKALRSQVRRSPSPPVDSPPTPQAPRSLAKEADDLWQKKNEL